MNRIHKNKKAWFNYNIEEEYEAGICLLGSEVKSIRAGRVNLGDSYVVEKNGELFIMNSHISPYSGANQFNHDPRRLRKILLKKQQIKKITGKITEKGFSLIPLMIYFNNKGLIKVKIGIGKGKKLYDKRASIKQKDEKRRMARSIDEY